MAAGAFVAVAMGLWIFSPSEASAYGATTGGTTGGTSGGTTGTAGYNVSWESSDGSCYSRGVNVQPVEVEYPHTSTDSLGTSTNSVLVYSGAVGNGQQGGGPGEADCDEEGATFTATLTWNAYGGAATPDAVIVKETVYVRSQGKFSTLAVDPGFEEEDDGVQFDAEGTGEGTYGKWITATRWSVKYDDDEFTVSNSPKAWASLATSDNLPFMYAEAQIDYTVTAYPVNLTVSGVLAGQETNRILIGQELTATMSTGGFDPGESEIAYSWNVSGGDPFESFTYTQSATTFVDWNDPVNQLAAVDFFYAEPNSSTVTCVFEVPELDIYAVADEFVEVEEPITTLVHAVIGEFQYIPNATNPTAFSLYGASIPEVSGVSGLIELYWVETPEDYWIGAMKGQYAWVQTMEDRNKSNLDNGGWLLIGDPGPGLWLDHAHPYPTVGGWYQAIGEMELSETSKPYFRDKPGFDGIDVIPADADDDQGQEFSSFGMRYDTDYHLFLMYDPPGAYGSTAEVPLRCRTWLAYGQFVWTASGGWGAPVDGSDIGDPVEDYPNHPVWTGRFNPQTGP